MTHISSITAGCGCRMPLYMCPHTTIRVLNTAVCVLIPLYMRCTHATLHLPAAAGSAYLYHTTIKVSSCHHICVLNTAIYVSLRLVYARIASLAGGHRYCIPLEMCPHTTIVLMLRYVWAGGSMLYTAYYLWQYI